MSTFFVTLLTLATQVKGRLASEDEGATAVEYGLMVALIAVVIIGAVGALGTSLSTLFTSVAGSIAAVMP